MAHILWHGTNQNFDKFEMKALGLSTSNPASKAAFFFSSRPESAWDYACSAAKKLVEDHYEHQAKVVELLYRAEKASQSRNFDLYETLIIEVENLESEALQAPAKNMVILKCQVTLENPMEIAGQDRAAVVDLGGTLMRAKDNGHDGLILRDIHDTPSGLVLEEDHFAVFDPEKIEIKDRFFTLEAALRETGLEENSLE
jgi:hypothetical protein